MSHTIAAELVANVVQVLVAGRRHRCGPTDTLVILLESMKMEIPVLAEVAGVVAELAVRPGRRHPRGRRHRRDRHRDDAESSETMIEQQKRVLRTEIPGPRSVALHARKTAAVAGGVGTTLPVYVERAGGGIVVDVDGNQLIDFGSGIAVTSVGNAAPRVVERRAASRSPTSPTPASWSRRTRGTSRSPRSSTS